MHSAKNRFSRDDPGFNQAGEGSFQISSILFISIASCGERIIGKID